MFKLLLFLTLFLPTLLFSNSDSFAKKMGYSTNYQEAKKLSIAKYKPMMIVIGTITCPWCKKMENQTLKKKHIDNFVQLHFTPVKLIKEKDKYPVKILDAKVVPTIFFLDPKSEKVFHISRGYKNKKKFLEQLQKAKSIYYNQGNNL